MRGHEKNSQSFNTSLMNAKVDPITLTIEEETDTGKYKKMTFSKFDRDGSYK